MICLVCGMRGCISQGEWVEEHQGQRAIRERWSCFDGHVWDEISARSPVTHRYETVQQIVISVEENVSKSRVG